MLHFIITKVGFTEKHKHRTSCSNWNLSCCWYLLDPLFQIAYHITRYSCNILDAWRQRKHMIQKNHEDRGNTKIAKQPNNKKWEWRGTMKTWNLPWHQQRQWQRDWPQVVVRTKSRDMESLWQRGTHTWRRDTRMLWIVNGGAAMKRMTWATTRAAAETKICNRREWIRVWSQ